MHFLARRALVWLRRDLRLSDNTALWVAARECETVACAFVLDAEQLRGERAGAAIVTAFLRALADLRTALRERGSDLVLLEGACAAELTSCAERLGADALYYAEDVEPAARSRDARVETAFRGSGRSAVACRDHAYYWADEIRQGTGKPYAVFTPYKRRWLERHAADPRAPLPSERIPAGRFLPRELLGRTRSLPTPQDYGHEPLPGFPLVGESAARALLARFVAGPIRAYQRERNVPALAGTSHLSPHLRAGTIGIRSCVAAAAEARAGAPDAAARLGAETWLSELIWRDFYLQILANFPHVARGPFLPAARNIPWRGAEADFEAWAQGRTGYPIVDAAMVQLNTTGWMHNRLRMIAASFLTKHLLLDYRRGERYFEQRLADADLAANNGGWQWAASTGTDAAPYFRIFNPTLQGEKFDPQGTFVRAMLPGLAALPAKYVHAPQTLPPLLANELGFALGRDYPEPIVPHAYARARALAAFEPVLGRKRADGDGA